MSTHVILLNGGSSSGKTTIAEHLQTVLPEPWLAVSIDDFVDALPPSVRDVDAGIAIGDDGSVAVGGEFRRMEAAWMRGIAAIAQAGVPVIIDDVWLGGADSQRRWRDVLIDLRVAWIGVRCDGAVAARREATRGDRPVGMAELQAEKVHAGVTYDLEVDTERHDPGECALRIARFIAERPTAKHA